MGRLRTNLQAAAALLVVALVLALPAALRASQGFTLALPQGNKPPVNGLSIVFDTTWPEGGGYLPIRITLRATPPAKIDRLLTLEITNSRFGERRPISVTKDVVIPAGARSVRVVIPYPRRTIYYSTLSFDVWESGVRLRDLCFENHGMFVTGMRADDCPKILFVTSGTVDLSAFKSVTGPSLDYVWASNVAGNPSQPITTSSVGTFASMPAADLFDDWINYSALDVIFIRLSELQDLADTRPKVLDALRSWTLAGGNLCVHGVGDDWKKLKPLDELLRLPGRTSEAEPLPEAWNQPDWRLNDGIMHRVSGATVVRDNSDVDDEKENKSPIPHWQAPFVWRPADMGLVVAMAKEDPFPGKDHQWGWLFNTIGESRWQWQWRHGAPIENGALDFDRYAIDDVGLPPVRTYRVLITMFVLGIGPLNYWLLRRKRRLHLLLFTVPAAALAVSLLLLGYAIVADGFDTYLRARSFTMLDQTRDEAVSWARLSYYAGMAPSSGLDLPMNVAILPIDRDGYHNGSTQPLRAIDWNRSQHLSAGWIPSRTPVQYVTMRPYATKQELRVLETPGATACAVENRLGANIKYLMLRSAAGDLYGGRAIGRDHRITLELLDTDEKVERTVSNIVTSRGDAESDAPTPTASPASSFLFGGPRSYQYRGVSYGGGSRLDTALDDAFKRVASKLPDRRSYVAIVERPPGVIVGVEDPIERQSLHVISGTW